MHTVLLSRLYAPRHSGEITPQKLDNPRFNSPRSKTIIHKLMVIKTVFERFENCGILSQWIADAIAQRRAGKSVSGRYRNWRRLTWATRLYKLAQPDQTTSYLRDKVINSEGDHNKTSLICHMSCWPTQSLQNPGNEPWLLKVDFSTPLQ